MAQYGCANNSLRSLKTRNKQLGRKTLSNAASLNLPDTAISSGHQSQRTMETVPKDKLLATNPSYIAKNSDSTGLDLDKANIQHESARNYLLLGSLTSSVGILKPKQGGSQVLNSHTKQRSLLSSNVFNIAAAKKHKMTKSKELSDELEETVAGSALDGS
jgi:hypothetical protein